MRRSSLLLFVLLVTLSVAFGPMRADAYRPPANAPVVDKFRPPSNPYGPGNRGIDYGVARGVDVKAAGPGIVDFAGQVGGQLFVVVRHHDGLRTTYGYLDSITVYRGQKVTQETVVGKSGPSLHFGVRDGETYVDPMKLFGKIFLVPTKGHADSEVSSQGITQAELDWLKGS